MLVQMENFDGIFIATTNLMNNLDKASLRRFDLKLEFDFLKSQQAWELFESECKNLNIQEYEDLKKQIKSLSCLTPGDFAAVIRQSRFMPIKNSNDFYNRLKDEVEVKQVNNDKTMGFI
jgi:ATP-dependent 26S proteasome regulatory subunit